MYDSEAFPNADHLFSEAFAALNPVPPLLRLMNEAPGFYGYRSPHAILLRSSVKRSRNCHSRIRPR
jgi:hypothetical protein